MFVEANRKPGILYPMKMHGKYEDVPIHLNPFAATRLVHPHHLDESVSRFQGFMSTNSFLLYFA